MKAVVLETRGYEAALLLWDGTVRRAFGDYTAGETVDFREKAAPSLRQWIAAAVVMVILLGSGAGLWTGYNRVACAEVSLDANASIVYTLNRRNRVLAVRAANEDGESVVNTLKERGVRDLSIEEALEKTVAILEDEGYLSASEEDCVRVSVSADKPAIQARVTEQVSEAMEKVKESAPALDYRLNRPDQGADRPEAPGPQSDTEANSESPEELRRQPGEMDDRAVPETASEPEVEAESAPLNDTVKQKPALPAQSREEAVEEKGQPTQAMPEMKQEADPACDDPVPEAAPKTDPSNAQSFNAQPTEQGSRSADDRENPADTSATPESRDGSRNENNLPPDRNGRREERASREPGEAPGRRE